MHPIVIESTTQILKKSRVNHHTKKQGNHRKSYMVIYENIKVIESIIKFMVTCKS